MSVNFSSAPRGPFPGQFTPGTPVQSGRFRPNYQQSPPPNSSHYGGHGGSGGGGSGGGGSGGGSGGAGESTTTTTTSSSRSGGSRGHKDRSVALTPNDIKIPKPPKQPDKPLPAYMRYSRKVWESVKNKNPEMKMWDIGKLIGEQWRNLPEDERQGFNAEYEVEKLEYQEAMKVYHNSQAYRDWLKTKEKAQQAIQEQQLQEKLIGGSMPKEEPRFQLQQIEEDDDEGDFSVKHIAASRFQRNQRLITEILSDTVVPDVKTIVTRPRHENLKRQVQSLMQHQRKLESEIQDMEEKFAAKKKKIMDQSAQFEENIKSFLGPLPAINLENTPETPLGVETSMVENLNGDSPALPEVTDLVPTNPNIDATSDSIVTTEMETNSKALNNSAVQEKVLDKESNTVMSSKDLSTRETSENS